MVMVFLSHSEKDTSLARNFLKEELSKATTVFSDKGEMAVMSSTEILAGENWQNLLEDELRNAQVMVVILTPESAQSPQTFFEIGAAVADGKKIITVLSEEINPDKVPEPLRHLRLIKKSEARGEISRAVKSVMAERDSKER